MRSKRFQSRVTAGRFTLPAAILISLLCWGVTAFLLPGLRPQPDEYFVWQAFTALHIPLWLELLSGYLLYGIIGYFLIGLNNAFAIIRMRASVQTAVYFLLIAVCPPLHRLYAGDVAAATWLISLYFLFRSYQKERPSADLFHAFLFLGLGSLVFPRLIWLAPLLWIGAYRFRSLGVRSFFASWVGWSVPYWFLLGYAFLHGDMGLFYLPLREMIAFTPPTFDLPPWLWAMQGYLLLLLVVSSAHCLLSGYEDKMRTRAYLHFLILSSHLLVLVTLLQPGAAIHFLSLQLIGTSILAGHLFALTTGRSSNLFFILMFVLLFILFGFSVWTLL